MSIAIENSGSNESWSGTAHTVTLTLTAGNSLVVVIVWRGNTASVSSVTLDAQNLSSTGAAQYQATGELSCQIWYLDSIAGSGAGQDITVNMSATVGGSMFVYQLSGTDSADVFDAENNASSATGTPSLSLTTANANASIFAAAAGDFGNGNFAASGAGYVTISIANIWGYTDGEYILDAGASGAKTVAMTAFSSAWIFKAAAFNAAAAAVVSSPKLLLTGVG